MVVCECVSECVCEVAYSSGQWLYVVYISIFLSI